VEVDYTLRTFAILIYPFPMKENLVAQIIKSPSFCQTLTPRQWGRLVSQARISDLLARVYCVLQESNQDEYIPEPLRWHFRSAWLTAQRHEQSVRWEVSNIEQALAALNVPCVLLKGAAYILADLPVARGRVFVDVDIMVPKSSLEQVETRLYQAGWFSGHNDLYDQRYYRTWMHELPPLRHVDRHTLLDVHHTILPETCRLHPDALKLFSASILLDSAVRSRVLSPMDMILHSASHLFHDGEFEHGLRDLIDIDCLLRHFAKLDCNFWAVLVERSLDMDLVKPLFYAMRYCRLLLATPIPESASVRVVAAVAQPWLMSQLMDFLFLRGLTPDHDSCRKNFTDLAKWLLYIRSHYLRMPLRLLIPHLCHKAFVSPEKTREVQA